MPVFTLGLTGGHKMHLVWRNYEGDSGWDYLLTAEGYAKPLEIAALEGHFRRSALSWMELQTIAAQPDTELRPGQRLLLTLPALGDASLPDNAAKVVAAALTEVGMVRWACRRCQGTADGMSPFRGLTRVERATWIAGLPGTTQSARAGTRQR